MTQVKWLYQLQQLDLEIDAATERLNGVDAQLGDRRALDEFAASLAQKRQALAELTSEQRLMEWEAQDQANKLAAVEQKLYGGSVRNPKELTALQQDAELLRKQYQGIEDRLLAVMVESDARQQEIDRDKQALARMEVEWQRSQAELAQEQASLKDTLEVMAKKRKELLSHIDHGDLEIYQALRDAKQGKAVARVEQGMCQGCRINLPTSELRLVRAGNCLVQCASCQRILYME
ncbi:MAG: hypothetical protein HY669_02320 [Chloroflexi bacterium]|nr:hypothetical protein [Chloroflexota bacterium]